MKFLLPSLLLTGSIFAMQPQSKNDCFVAHTRFKAMITLLSGHIRNLTDKNGNAVTDKSFNQIYEEFLQECREEALQKSKERLAISQAVTQEIDDLMKSIEITKPSI